MGNDKNVKSENQTGGITAYNVEIGNDAISENEEKAKPTEDSNFWKVIGYIALIATILSTVIAALKFF